MSLYGQPERITTTPVPGGSFLVWSDSSLGTRALNQGLLVLEKGKFVDEFHFSMDGVVEPTVTERSVPGLGK